MAVKTECVCVCVCVSVYVCLLPVDICGYSPLIRNPVCAHVRRKPHDVGTLYEVSLLETRAQAGDGEMTAAGAPGVPRGY